MRDWCRMTYVLKINGKSHKVDVDGETPLLWVLRDVLKMTEVWMRYGALRRLYGSHRRRGDTILHHHGRQCRGGRSDYYRSHRRDSCWREGAAGVARSSRRSVRIFSSGADPGGSCAAGEHTTPP